MRPFVHRCDARTYTHCTHHALQHSAAQQHGHDTGNTTTRRGHQATRGVIHLGMSCLASSVLALSPSLILPPQTRLTHRAPLLPLPLAGQAGLTTPPAASPPRCLPSPPHCLSPAPPPHTPAGQQAVCPRGPCRHPPHSLLPHPRLAGDSGGGQPATVPGGGGGWGEGGVCGEI